MNGLVQDDEKVYSLCRPLIVFSGPASKGNDASKTLHVQSRASICHLSFPRASLQFNGRFENTLSCVVKTLIIRYGLYAYIFAEKYE